ncbi:MAG TPA: hypothetical protein VN809_10810 [Telmatospirillum sp.]|nr:hypothetical protein [Telmatospirillum sp.]
MELVSDFAHSVMLVITLATFIVEPDNSQPIDDSVGGNCHQIGRVARNRRAAWFPLQVFHWWIRLRVAAPLFEIGVTLAEAHDIYFRPCEHTRESQ